MNNTLQNFSLTCPEFFYNFHIKIIFIFVSRQYNIEPNIDTFIIIRTSEVKIEFKSFVSKIVGISVVDKKYLLHQYYILIFPQLISLFAIIRVKYLQ